MQRAVPRRFFDPVVELLLSVLFVGCVLSGSAPIRLVNERPNACSGRVEILYGGQWGTVCDDSWGIEDANVVCRQIGCGHAIAAKEAAYFGQGSGKIWLDEVVCTGTESTLTACQHPGWEKHNCGHGEDAGVECSGSAPIIRLVNGPNACIGRVEILYGGQWGTICDDSWEIDDANVVCRQIGCGHAIAAKQSAYFGQGSGSTWLDNVGCTGTESTLTACEHPGWEQHNCGHGEDAGVACSDGLQKPNISLNSTYSLFKAGENVLLSCHVPVFGMDRKVHFNFVHSPNPIAEMIVSDRENIKSHELNGLHISNGGMYTCLYEVGLQFKSQLSDPVQIDVVNLLQPNISMEPTSGEVMPGQSLVVHCTAECSYPKVMFILNQKASTENISMSSSAINNSAIFTIPAENITAGGHFFCSYEVQSQSRSLLSPPSNILRAFVPSDIKIIYIGASAGALFLVVVVILALVIFWWRRTSKQPSSAVVSHSGGLHLKDGVSSGLKPKVVNSAYHAEPTKEDYCSDEMYTNMGSHEQDSKDLSQEKLSCDQEYGNNYEILFRNPPHNEQKEMAGEEDYGTIYTQEPEDCAEAIYQNWEG